MNRSMTRITTATLVLGGALLGGCWGVGGTRGWVPDSYTYESTPDMPYTVSIVDARTGETLWSLDVPVEQQLSFNFVKGDNQDLAYPDKMSWDVWEMGTRWGNPKNELAVPAAHSRIIDAKLRKAPELPPHMRPMGDTPWMQPAPVQPTTGADKSVQKPY